MIDLPVVMIADFTTAGLQSGCADLRIAATAAICGQAIEVPDSSLKLNGPCFVDGDETGDQDARMFTPGAATSGCNASQWRRDYLYFAGAQILNHDQTFQYLQYGR